MANEPAQRSKQDPLAGDIAENMEHSGLYKEVLSRFSFTSRRINRFSPQCGVEPSHMGTS